MKKSVIVKTSKIQGKGVFATKNFAKNEVVLAIDDSHVVKDPSKLTLHQEQYDCDYLANNTVVFMPPPEKYINHSCDPNTYVKTINGTRQVIAMKQISVGEEITYDCAINGYNDGTFICSCKAKNCRKIYQGNFFKLPLTTQKKYLPYLEDWFINEHPEEIKKLSNCFNHYNSRHDADI